MFLFIAKGNALNSNTRKRLQAFAAAGYIVHIGMD